MVLIIQFSFVFLFSLGVLYNPEKLRGVRDVFLFLTFRPLPLAGHRRGSFLLLKYAHSITSRYSSPDMMIFNYSYFCIKPNVPSRTCTPLPPAMVGGRGVHFIVPHSLSAKRAPLPAVSFLHISGPHLFIFCILFNIAAHSVFPFYCPPFFASPVIFLFVHIIFSFLAPPISLLAATLPLVSATRSLFPECKEAAADSR